VIWKVVLYASVSVILSVMLYQVATLGFPVRCDDKCISDMRQEAHYRMHNPDQYGN
jgi:hypothetical protein